MKIGTRVKINMPDHKHYHNVCGVVHRIEAFGVCIQFDNSHLGYIWFDKTSKALVVIYD